MANRANSVVDPMKLLGSPTAREGSGRRFGLCNPAVDLGKVHMTSRTHSKEASGVLSLIQ